MASKNKTCDFCGAKHIRLEMVEYEGKFLCDQMCKDMWKEAYEEKEVKPIAKRVGNSK